MMLDGYFLQINVFTARSINLHGQGIVLNISKKGGGGAIIFMVMWRQI